MAKLTWLHIADTQFRSLSSSMFNEKLLDDITKQISINNLRPDLIFATGDVAFSGQTEEYREATSFFQRLLSQTHIDRKNIYFIPGNHDINRTPFDYPINKSSGLNKYSVDDSPLGNYFDFVSSFLGNKRAFNFEMAKYVDIKKLKLADIQIAIVGLNTTWADKYKQNEDKFVNIREAFNDQLIQALSYVKDADIRIALMHYSPDDISIGDGDKLYALIVNTCDFVLHSHVHMQNENYVRVIENTNRSPTVVINSGSYYKTEEHPNVYSLVQVNFETGQGAIFRRFYDIKEDEWVVDSRVKAFNSRIQSRFNSKIADQEPSNDHLPKDNVLQSVDSQPDFKSGNLYGEVLPGYSNDTTSGPDQLGIKRDVEAFAAVLAARQVEPPLCLGLFGDWGSGKSFFMGKLKDRITLLADLSREAEGKKEHTEFCSYVAHVEFNAWHYADSNLWASLACRIFQELDSIISIRRGKRGKE